MKNYLDYKIPKSEYEDRIKKLQTEIKKREIDLGLIFCTPCKPGDLMYFTGIDPNIFDAGAIVSQDKFFVIGGFETHEYSMDIMQAGEYKIIEGYDVVGDWPGVEFNKIEDIVKEAAPRINRLALLTSNDVMTLGFFKKISELINDVEIIDATDIIADLRYIKSINEQKIIKSSNLIATEGMKSMLKVLKPGLRETEVAAEGDYTMKKWAQDHMALILLYFQENAQRQT